jgi:hypothetical protein
MAAPNNRPPLKICPSCGITMVMTKSPVMSKSRPITVDIWKCLRCDFEIAVRPPEQDDPKAEPSSGSETGRS